MDKLEILKSALIARDDEIMSYQINIDNYSRAIDKIDYEHRDKPAITKFRDSLYEMLEQNKLEQLKSQIIRDVIADQLTEMEAL